ncbi:conserved hypothetical protein [Coccidioides posadasii str. Silveira]|uniref:Uncharacterized protein n=1 Tax=Coccidioides posadasii (strain RMSCC 757 / Silveira) TaxID=443226 RepID=E9DC31_COCPS|nr:conserved hypothetical protein [Coccidioides posadasii str. Silveira]
MASILCSLWREDPSRVQKIFKTSWIGKNAIHAWGLRDISRRNASKISKPWETLSAKTGFRARFPKSPKMQLPKPRNDVWTVAMCGVRLAGLLFSITRHPTKRSLNRTRRPRSTFTRSDTLINSKIPDARPASIRKLRALAAVFLSSGATDVLLDPDRGPAALSAIPAPLHRPQRVTISSPTRSL